LVVGIQMDESEDSEQVPNKPICMVNKASVYNTHVACIFGYTYLF